jgi:hypothetical protein
MKLRLFSSILIFVSAYSPLSIIFLIQDIDLPAWRPKHPYIVWSMVGVSILSCIMVWAAVRLLKTSSPPIKVIKVSNRSGELINYSIPYLVTSS